MASYIFSSSTPTRLAAAANYTRSVGASTSNVVFIAINETDHALTLTFDISTDQGQLRTANHSTNRRPLLGGDEVDSIVVDGKSFVKFEVIRVDDGATAAPFNVEWTGVRTPHGTSMANAIHNLEEVSVIREATLGTTSI